MEWFPSFWRMAFVAGMFVWFLPVAAQEVDLSAIPPAADRAVHFREDVLPILEGHCFQCHGEERPKGGFNLRRRETALAGGDQGRSILLGDGANSPLIHYAAHLVEDMEMPPIGKAERLTDGQVGTLISWIDQGLVWEESAGEGLLQYVFEPTLGHFWVFGDERKFREHSWLADGFSGGFAALSLKERLQDGAQLELRSRSLWRPEDHEIELSLRKPDLGFFTIGYRKFRRYYDDTGGYYSHFGQEALSLDRDLHLDSGRAWIEVGLGQGDRTTITLGYENQFRDGEKSTIHWGSVFPEASDGGAGKGILPSAKRVDENTHVFKADFQHEWPGGRFEESFRGELANFDTRRETVEFAVVGSNPKDWERAKAKESYQHFSGVNTFRIEKQIKPWWLLSSGYLYANLTADAQFDLERFLPSNSPATPFQEDFSRSIYVKRNSHVVNFNSRFGPWNGWSFFAGAQNDWTRQSGDGDLFLYGITLAQLDTNLDQRSTEENFGLRYTKIRNAVVYADAKFQQTKLDQREGQFVDDGFAADNDFMRQTDATTDYKEGKAGLRYSPRRWFSLDLWYRKRRRQNNYDHRLDADGLAPPGNGYPAFIRSRSAETDDFQIQWTLRPSSRLRSSLSYRLTAIDYGVASDSVSVFGAVFPPGQSQANYNAQRCAISAAAQPWRRLRLVGTAAISDLRTTSGITDNVLLTPYNGQIYTVTGTANLAGSKTLHWDATYSFSKADFRQSDTGLNLPIGIDYDRHGIVTGLTKQINDDGSFRLQYGFFRYKEPSVAGVNDYTAHGLAATFRWDF